MPRQSSSPVTRGPSSAPYTERPTVRSQLVDRQTPVIGSKAAGTEALGLALSGFFNAIGNGLADVQRVERFAKRAEIERENANQQAEAVTIAASGGELTAEQAGDWDYITPFNQVKAGRAVSEDILDFQTNVLRNLTLSDDPHKALTDYINRRLRGVENQQFAGFYAEGMLKASSEAIRQHRADLFKAALQDQVDASIASMASKIDLDQYTNADDFFADIKAAASVAGPAGYRDAEKAALSRALNLASIKGKLSSVVGFLTQDVAATEDNPQGLSWARRFPDAYNALYTEALKQEGAGYRQALDAAVYDIKGSLADGDLAGAVQKLISARDAFGSAKEFQALDLQVREAITKEWEAGSNARELEAALRSGIPPSPEALSSDAAFDMVRSAFASEDPRDAVNSLATMAAAWGSLGTKATQWINTGLTQTRRPEVIAAFLDKLLPVARTNPQAILGELNEDAEVMMRAAIRETTLGNKSTLEIATELSEAMMQSQASGVKPSDVKFWGNKVGARDEWIADIAGALEDTLGGTVSPSFVESTVLPAMQMRALKYQSLGFGADALEMAQDDILESTGWRTLVLTNPNGDTYVVEDTTPDMDPMTGERVNKWVTTTYPDGSTWDPNEAFREQSSAHPFLDAAGVAPGMDTSSDGAMTVVGSDGLPRRFTLGEEITWEIPNPAVANGMSADPFIDQTLTLPETEEEFSAFFEEKLAGTNFRLSRVAGAFPPVWELQVVPTPPAESPLETLAKEKTLENIREALESGIEKHGIRKRHEDFMRRFNDAMKVDAEIRDKIYAPWSEGITITGDDVKAFLQSFGITEDADPAGFEAFAETTAEEIRNRLDAGGNLPRSVPLINEKTNLGTNPGQDLARRLIAPLQEQGILPQSTGTTKPLPEFESPAQILDYIYEEAFRKKMANGNLPIEPLSTPTSESYVNKRRHFLVLNEGLRRTAYKDTKGLTTVGIGFNLTAPHVRAAAKELGIDVAAVEKGTPMTDEQIDALFEVLVSEAERVVSTRIKVPLSATQRLALVSMAYNNPDLIGPDLVEAINEGRWDDAVAEIKTKSNASGDRGIQNRRDREAMYFALGI